MFNVAANLRPNDAAGTVQRSYANGQGVKANKQAYEFNELRKENYLYEFGKQKKVDKAREAYFGAQNEQEHQQATAMLMAHDPEFLQGMADQQRAAQEAADKQAADDREAFTKLAPVITKAVGSIKSTPPEGRVAAVEAALPGVLASMPKKMAAEFQKSLQPKLADGNITDEELDELGAAFQPFMEKDDPSYQYKVSQTGEYVGLNPDDPSDVARTGIQARDPKGGQKLVVGPDGTITLASGAAANEAVTPTKSTTTNLQKDITSQSVLQSNMHAVGKLYDPEFMTAKSDIQNWAFKNKERFGGDLDAAEKDLLTRKTKFKTSVNRLFNAYRKEITGAAAAVQEMKDLKNSIINEDMSATEFEAAYGGMMDEIGRSLRLKNKLLRSGFTGDEFGTAFDDAYLMGSDDDPEDQFEYLVTEKKMAEADAVALMKSQGYD